MPSLRLLFTPLALTLFACAVCGDAGADALTEAVASAPRMEHLLTERTRLYSSNANDGAVRELNVGLEDPLRNRLPNGLQALLRRNPHRSRRIHETVMRPTQLPRAAI